MHIENSGDRTGLECTAKVKTRWRRLLVALQCAPPYILICPVDVNEDLEALPE